MKKNVQTELEIQDYLWLHNKATMSGSHLKDLVREILVNFIKVSKKEEKDGKGIE